MTGPRQAAELSGHTQPFAVLGHPIGHTLSPVMHNAAFSALALDAIYMAFDVHPDKLIPVLHAMGDMGYAGVNLTVPLKEVAFRGLEDLDESARRLGAVNTVEYLPDGGMRGHNTDGKGFVLAFREAFGRDVVGGSVLVLGSGGAGRAVAITCAIEGAKAITLTDIDASRAETLAVEIGKIAPSARVGVVPPRPEDWRARSEEADIVIQATPVGMRKEDRPLLGADSFHTGQMLLDLVYMYPRTGIMDEAISAGARAANGLGMLLHQGAWALRIWTGEEAAVDAMRRALESAVYGDAPDG